MTVETSKSFLLGCDPYIEVTVGDIKDPSNSGFQEGLLITVKAVNGDGTPLDIEGLFFNASDPDLLDHFRIWPEADQFPGGSGTPAVTGVEVGEGAVTGFGGDTLADGYDVGIRFGTEAGGSDGQVSHVSFTLSAGDQNGEIDLLIEDLLESSFAAVVRDADGERIVKLYNPTGEDDPDCEYPVNPEPPEKPEDCIDVAEGTECVIDLDNGSKAAGPAVEAGAQVASVVLDDGEFYKDGKYKLELDDVVANKKGASDITITDSAGTDIEKLEISKLGGSDDERDVLRFDLSTFDDDFEIKIKSEDEQDKIVFDNVDSFTVDDHGVYTIVYTGTDGKSHTVEIDPKDAEVIIADSDGAGDEGVTYSIVGGADADLFEVDPDTGEVCFKEAPDFENPQDQGADNLYEVVVRTTFDDGSFTDETLTVCVEDDCTPVEENTTAVADLDCGETEIPDRGTDLCDTKDSGGKPVELTMIYSFGTTFDQANDQDDGKRGIETFGSDDDGEVYIRVLSGGDDVAFEGTVSDGQAFTADAGGKFSSETVIEIYASQGGPLLQEVTVHTSCSQPLAIGDVFGSVQLAGAVLEDGDVIGLSADDDVSGDGGVTYEITGGDDADLFTVDPDTGEVSFKTPPDFENPQDADGDNQYLVEVTAFNADGSVCEVTPLDVCVTDTLDGPIEVEEGQSQVADFDLDVTCTEPGGDDGVLICQLDGKPVSLSFTYDFGTGFDQVADQDDDKRTLETFDEEDDGESFIRVLGKDGDALFEGTVAEGETFTVTPEDGKFDSATFVEIYDEEGGALLQEMEFHTSCSQPIAIGDTFGSLVLNGAEMEGGQTLSGTQSVTLDEVSGGIVYSISGGDDADAFTIDPDTGVLSFITPPDADATDDADGNGVYDVTVRATAQDDPDCFTEAPIEVDVTEADDDDDDTLPVVSLDDEDNPVIVQDDEDEEHEDHMDMVA